MIERLMDPETPYKDPTYIQLGREATALQEKLSKTLDEAQITMVRKLVDVYMGQLSMVEQDAFTDGFCAAVELMVEIYCHSAERGYHREN